MNQKLSKLPQILSLLKRMLSLKRQDLYLSLLLNSDTLLNLNVLCLNIVMFSTTWLIGDLCSLRETETNDKPGTKICTHGKPIGVNSVWVEADGGTPEYAPWCLDKESLGIIRMWTKETLSHKM